MGDTSGCQISRNNLAVYLQGVTVTPSSNITSEYFVTASLPSSASLRRVWQFTTQGTVKGPTPATLTLDYTQARINCPLYNITFEGALNGTLTIQNQVFSANKYISYVLQSDNVLVLFFKKLPRAIVECYGPSTPLAYSFTINLNDAANSTCCGALNIPYTANTTITITPVSGTSGTISYLVVGGGGAGGSSTPSGFGGGGGGGGQVLAGCVSLTSSATWTLTVGQTSTFTGNVSSITDQSGNTIASAAGGQPGGNSGGASGSGSTGGAGSSGGGGGGGGGDTSSGSAASGTSGGNGGGGTQWSCNSKYYGGGGGGGGKCANQGGNGGTGGGGNGGDGCGTSGQNCDAASLLTISGRPGTSNTGGGGGGAGYGCCSNNDCENSGGNGAAGTIILSYNTSEYTITTNS